MTKPRPRFKVAPRQLALLILCGVGLFGCASPGPDDSITNWIHCYYGRTSCLCGTDSQLGHDIGDLSSAVAVDDCTEAASAAHFGAASAVCQADIKSYPSTFGFNSACACAPVGCGTDTSGCECAVDPNQVNKSMASCPPPGAGNQCCMAAYYGACRCGAAACGGSFDQQAQSCSAASIVSVLPAVDMPLMNSATLRRTAACMPFLASHPVQ